MLEETLLAFDYGAKKLGVALGNSLLRQARPLDIILEQTRVGRFERIEKLIRTWKPDRVVVGLALEPDGSEHYPAGHCRRFARQIEGRFGIPVVMVDERGSSVEAQKITGNDHDDAQAAAIILQRYFDALT
ncbi:Holliday junction resolvase RuvX [Orrella sp. NBD-18]|uniref:Putative pre-16S rRNA nuclease n=1 Tax=Sheuella amnicola TaxID=2707330 RepID=A0A6B2R1Y3_9BURK|nr:Holliday junction resolvase RuvX [Sheuella amnicola]NDY84242.1 Holliday junction resolvase RuvX [Sheuella amnicola]HBI82965.1 Holliday junction resolvase RuvX [Alcaligenaceae bacterium]